MSFSVDLGLKIIILLKNISLLVCMFDKLRKENDALVFRCIKLND